MTIKCDDGSVYLTRKQTRWVASQNLLFGNPQAPIFRGTRKELQNLVDGSEVAHDKDYLVFKVLNGTFPVACTNYDGPVPYIIFVPEEDWKAYKAKSRRKFKNFDAIELIGREAPHCGESPQGLLWALERVSGKEYPSWEELREQIPGGYEAEVDPLERKIDDIAFSLERLNRALKRANPRFYADLPDKVGRL